MTAILILVAAIVALMLVLQLRAMLSFPFAPARLRVVPARPPAGTEDQYAAAHEDLTALGFAGPTWVLAQAPPGVATTVPLRAMYHHPVEQTQAWLWPSVNAALPDRLGAIFTTALADGRLLVSQSHDIYFAATTDDKVIGLTVAPDNLGDHWQQHRRWRGSFSTAAAGHAADPARIVAAYEETHEAHRQRLIASRRLRADDDGVARPRLGFSMRMLWLHWRRPRAVAKSHDVPLARLVAFAGIAEINRNRAPPRHVQWGFFAVSLVLSLLLGAMFWDFSFALILLVVIAIHELGHFVAMRAFGYRNVHMLALPLVGGVTIGHDASPDASRQAWMSLMGPLPGIVIGWALLAWAIGLFGARPDIAWLYPAAAAFLIVNYLNMLPIPPLDGAHVVRAMLPPRWLAVHAWLALAMSVAGIVLGWYTGLSAVMLLAAFQIPVALGVFAQARAARRLDTSVDDLRSQSPQARTQAALQALHDTDGPAKSVAARVTQALSLRQVLETRPMSWLQRGAIGGVYAALLAAPVGMIAYTFNDWRLPTRVIEQVAWKKKVQALEERSHALDDTELLRDLRDGKTAGTASEQDIAAAESRLGTPLGPRLRELYRRSDGIEPLGVPEIASLAPIDDPTASTLRHVFALQGVAIAGKDEMHDDYEHPVAVRPGSVDRWLLLVHDQLDAVVLYVPPGAEPAALADHIVDCTEGCLAYAQPREWLRRQWLQREFATFHRD